MLFCSMCLIKNVLCLFVVNYVIIDIEYINFQLLFICFLNFLKQFNMFYIYLVFESSYVWVLLGLLLDWQFWLGYQLLIEIDLLEVKGVLNNEMFVFLNLSNGFVRLEFLVFNLEIIVL